jgi:hypothetical protein
MSISVKPSNPSAGQIITFHLKYEGTPPPVPDDVHVWVEKQDGTWTRVTGYDRIPRDPDNPVEDKDPLTGFGLPIPPTPDWIAPGRHRFKVQWTSGGKEISTEITSVTTTSIPSPKEWSWGDFWGKVLGGVIASLIFGALSNWWSGVAFVPCLVTGAAGGAVGSALGQLLAWLLDAPKIKWTFRSAMLFSLFFTLAFAAVLGLLAVGLEREAIARGEVYDRVTFGISALSGFLAAIFGGVLNNLREEP